MPGAAQVKFKPTAPRRLIIMPDHQDQQARRIAFERGESIVLAGLTQPADIDQAKSLPYADMRMTLVSTCSMYVQHAQGSLSDPAFRQAFAHMWIVTTYPTLFKGYMMLWSSFVLRCRHSSG